MSTERTGIRDRYAAHARGATGYYDDAGVFYANPHVAAVARGVGMAIATWPSIWLTGSRYLDLCCGAGEVTSALVADGIPAERVEACDPYTEDAYRARNGRSVVAGWTFADIADGAVPVGRYDVAVCSYALHLCEKSRLPGVCAALARVVPTLVVVTPHKRPILRSEWGYLLIDELHDPETRVRVRRYDSTVARLDWVS